MIELERTFLAKHLPAGLKECKYKEVYDIYLPPNSRHPVLRIRKNGNKFEITKKEPIDPKDTSRMKEETVNINEEEFNSIKEINGKRLRKLRYYYKYGNHTAEVDVFQDDLKGLVIIDFEFNDENEKNAFKMPDFCLVDITQEEFTAGGMLCGKKYNDIEPVLKKYNYLKII